MHLTIFWLAFLINITYLSSSPPFPFLSKSPFSPSVYLNRIELLLLHISPLSINTHTLMFGRWRIWDDGDRLFRASCYESESEGLLLIITSMSWLFLPSFLSLQISPFWFVCFFSILFSLDLDLDIPFWPKLLFFIDFLFFVRAAMDLYHAICYQSYIHTSIRIFSAMQETNSSCMNYFLHTCLD